MILDQTHLIANLVLITMSSLLLGFVATRLSKTLRLPHSVFLVLTGLAMGGFLQYSGVHIQEDFTKSFADIMLFVLLPPLIFESAYCFEFKELKKNLFAISSLAFIGVIISTLIIGFSLHHLFSFALIPSLVFGVLISATDPVAVVALFKEVGAPKKLLKLVEGESLFNDGTAIVLYKILIASVAASSFGFEFASNTLTQIAIVVGGGLLVGLIASFVASLLIKLTSETSSAQIGISITTSYLAFIVADHFFHVSGIFATLVVGLHLGHFARMQFNKESFHSMHSVWSFVALAANSVVFLLVGLFVDYNAMLGVLSYAPYVLAVVYLARIAAVPVALIPNNLLLKNKWVSLPFQAILCWGGLRGGLAMALAVLLPVDFPHKKEFVALTTIIVLATLLINAVSISHLMKLFKLDKLNLTDQRILQQAANSIFSKFLSLFKSSAEQGVLSPLIVDQTYKTVKEKSHIIEQTEEDLVFEYRQVLLLEKAYYNHLLEDRELSPLAYKALMNDIDRRLHAIKDTGHQNISGYAPSYLQKEGTYSKLLGLISKKWHRKHRFNNLTLDLEVLIFCVFGLKKVLQQTHENGSMSETLNRWEDQVTTQLHDLFMHYPHWANSIQYSFIAKMLTHSSQGLFEEYLHESVIGESIYLKAKALSSSIEEELLSHSKKYNEINSQFLLMGVRSLNKKPQAELKQLAEQADLNFISHGKALTSENIEKNKMHVLVGGNIYVPGPFVNRNMSNIELNPNDSFIITKQNGQYICLIEHAGDFFVQNIQDVHFVIKFDTEFFEVPMNNVEFINNTKVA